LILNGDFSMSNNYRQLICTFILQNWASWEDRILISPEHNMTTSVYIIVMLSGNGWATSSEIAAASLLLDLEIDVWLHQRNVYSKNTFIPCNLNFYTFHLFLSGSHFQSMRKIHHVNNSSDVLKSQPTNSSGSKKRKGSKIALLNKNRKLGLHFKVPSDLESAEERKKRKQRLRSKISFQLKTLNIPENEIPNPPPLSNDSHFNKVMECIRKFELEQISLFINFCSICK
jgi:hypothetical protein